MVHKKNKKKKKQKKHHRNFILFLIMVTGFIFFVTVTGYVYTMYRNFTKNDDIKKSLFKTLMLAPTLIPTSTLIPAPTEIPYVGYCLHVPVLFYHHIQPNSVAKEKGQTALSVDNGVFDQQMAYLVAQGYTTLIADQLVNALLTKTSLPTKSVLITLDDGYKDAFTYAFPVIQKYNLSANLMIPAGLMEGADYLSWSDITQMVKGGHIYITNHTWSHYNLGKNDIPKIKSEVEIARQILEQKISQKVDIFTYPYGTSTALAAQILQEEGVRGAFTTLAGTIQCDSFIMTLHRTRVGNSPLSFYGL